MERRDYLLLFSRDEADKIVRIPLATESHDDFMIWKGKPFGMFTVRSDYQLLQNFSSI